MKKVILLIICIFLFTACGTDYIEEFEEIYALNGFDAALDYYEENRSKLTDDEAKVMLDYARTRVLLNDFGGGLGFNVDMPIYDSTDYSVLDIESMNITDGKLTLTVKNNGTRTIDYFEYNIYFHKNDEIIDSDWSNSSKTIKPNARCTDDTYVDVPSGTTKYSIEIVDISHD